MTMPANRPSQGAARLSRQAAECPKVYRAQKVNRRGSPAYPHSPMRSYSRRERPAPSAVDGEPTGPKALTATILGVTRRSPLAVDVKPAGPGPRDCQTCSHNTIRLPEHGRGLDHGQNTGLCSQRATLYGCPSVVRDREPKLLIDHVEQRLTSQEAAKIFRNQLGH